MFGKECHNGGEDRAVNLILALSPHFKSVEVNGMREENLCSNHPFNEFSPEVFQRAASRSLKARVPRSETKKTADQNPEKPPTIISKCPPPAIF